MGGIGGNYSWYYQRPKTVSPAPAPAPSPLPIAPTSPYQYSGYPVPPTLPSVTLPPPPTLAPPPPLPVLPPAPSLPAPPTIPQIPQFDSQYLPQFQALLDSLKNYNALPNLDATTQQGLAATTAAEQSAANINFRDAFDKALADLYGGGIAQSTIATDAEGRLAVDKANVFSQIAGRDADRALALRQYLGGAGLQALGLQGSTLGTAGGLEQGQYNTEVQALLQRAGLANQQYGQQSNNLLNLFGQQSQNALGLGGLANQQYGTQTGNQVGLYGAQTGNILNQAQLQQQGLLGLYGQQSANAGNQQQMIYQLLNNLLSGQYNGALQYGVGGQGGGYMGGGSYAGTPSGGVGGYTPGPTNQTQQQQQPNQIMMLLQQLFQMLGITLPGLGGGSSQTYTGTFPGGTNQYQLAGGY